MVKRVLVSVAAVLIGGGAVAMAADKPKAGPTTKPATTKPSDKPVNKFCGVEGEGHDVDPKVTTVYQGKTVGFCCNDCIDEFKKDPEKYMKKLK